MGEEEAKQCSKRRKRVQNRTAGLELPTSHVALWIANDSI